MSYKKKIKTKTKKRISSRSSGGLAKIATLTTRSLSSAIVNFKKNQELKKN